MKKKVISLMLSLAMLTSILAGCGSQTGNTPATGTSGGSSSGSGAAASGDPVTLKWAIWDESTTQYWGDLKAAYEATHSNVTIEMVDLGSTDYMTVLATELSGSGSDFDVVTIKDVPGYATLVQKNVILPLDDYIKADGIDLSKYAGATDQVLVDGKLYELPFRNDFWVIFYNKDVFDAAGVAYPTNDMTWEQYDALARKVTDTTFGSQIYGAVDTIVTVSEPTRNHYEQYRKLIDENRRQERELAAQHRAEEKAFANQFTEAEKESLRLAKAQAANTVGSLISSFKKNEKRLVNVVMVRSSDAGAAVMRFIKKRTESGSDEIFEIDEEEQSLKKE